ncbi:MAG: rhamnulokinase [Acidimicrobiaceae bacterium]|nr:rhamnulokinase [Acidimicrobiaceae bacterium]
MSPARVAAVDLGASSGRVLAVTIDEHRLELEEVARFWNGPQRAGERLCWDALGLYRSMLDGLADAAHGGTLDSVGIDGWGVDYGLLDEAGRLLSNPVCYRDARTRGIPAMIDHLIGDGALYRRTGIARQAFNTVFQLLAAREDADYSAARTLLLVPDLLAYWLTGVLGSEETNASTTGLLDLDGSDWDRSLMSLVGIDPALFPPLRRPGDRIGVLRPDTARELGFGRSPQVLAVGSHDTASAVAGTPAKDPRFAYISAGTSSLVGVELERPVISEASRLAKFTNERGIDSTVRFLHNVMGLWLLQQSLRTWSLSGKDLAFEEVTAAASAEAELRTIFDPDDPRYLAPGDMPARIAEACASSAEPVPQSAAQFARAIFDSLALAYRRAVLLAGELAGTQPQVVHLVGGGARNGLLCQLTADACGLPVVAGPVEAAAIGNAFVQARALGAIDADRWGMRQAIARQVELRYYEPARGSSYRWAEAEERLALQAPSAAEGPSLNRPFSRRGGGLPSTQGSEESQGS